MNRKDIFEMMKNLGEADFDAFPTVPPFEDAEVIHAYSRAEAIEDGVLIDVTKQAKIAGITLHSALTPGVWSEFISNPRWASWGTEEGRIVSLLAAAFTELERQETNIVFFAIRLTEENAIVDEIHLRGQRGQGDNLEPVLTVMLSHED